MADDIAAWFAAHVPKDWFTSRPAVTSDSEEILVVGELPAAEGETPAARIARFRAESRQKRMTIAHEAERRFRVKVSWGATCGGETELFTTASVPVMTRLRLPERHVLDTLIGAGVARSRSEALAWCVRLVGRHQADWIENLRTALTRVEEVRRQGPG